MLAMLLLAALPQDLLPLDEALVEPRVPGPEWIALDPEPIEGGEAFARFGGAFDGTFPAQWREARAAHAYLEVADLPEAPTLAQVRGSLLAVRAILRGSPTFDDGNGPRLRQCLLIELDGVLGRLPSDADLEQAPLTWEQSREFVSGRFERETATLSGEDGTLVTDSLFFPGEPTQVVLRLDRAANGLVGATPFAYYATLEQAIEFRAAVASVVAVFGVLVQPQLERTSQRLREIDGRWSNYLEYGFSQYPWESWANGWLTDFSWTRPPRSQWVLLHPELGFVFDTRSTRSAEMQAALLVHGVGYVRYFSDNEWFLGLSATASITNDRAYGMGFGPTLHFGHTKLASRVPHVSVGVMWQDFEVGGREPVLAATLDLWRLVDRGSDALYEARLLKR